MNLNYIIIEDNPGAIKNLQIALRAHSHLNEIGTASTAKAGIILTQTANPHLVFLDVELGNENGFDVLKEIRQFSGEIPFFIMTTDFSKYAKEAVNKDVLYFLEKPIDPDELALAVKKVKRKMISLRNHLTIKNTEGHNFIDLNKIEFIEADGNTCIIHLQDQQKIFVTKTLKKIEISLPPNFLRIHKSYIINCNFVDLLNTTQRKIILKLNGGKKEFPIGKSYLDRVRNLLLFG